MYSIKHTWNTWTIRSACIASTPLSVSFLMFFVDFLSCSLSNLFCHIHLLFVLFLPYPSYPSQLPAHFKTPRKHIQNALFVPPSPPQRPLRPPPIPRTHQHLCQTTHQRPPLPTQCPKPTHPRWTTTRQPPRPDRPPKRTSFPPHRRRCQTLCRPNTGGLSD